MRADGESRSDRLTGAGIISDREAELYVQWERIVGRTLRGLEGRYRILHPGRRNGGPGPDYLGAAIVFPDGSVRRGDVEIHLQGDHWHRHRHQWDQRYRRVILHVIAAGSLKAVPQDQWRVVPTVPLPREPASFQPLCETVPRALAGFQALNDFLHTLATQRWWRRLADWNSRTALAVLDALARRLGPDQHRLELVGLWTAQLPGEKDLYSFLSGIMSHQAFESGGKCRRELPGRVACLSALAFLHHHTPRKLWEWSLEEIQQLVRDLREGGFPVPTGSFLVEVLGNWLLPLSSAAADTDRFEEWYRLPLGWTYSRVSRHVKRLGLRRPATFGQQQGLLEWMETLCQPLECVICPVAEAAGEF